MLKDYEKTVIDNNFQQTLLLIPMLILFVFNRMVDVNEHENSFVESIMSLNFLSGNRLDATPHYCEG